MGSLNHAKEGLINPLRGIDQTNGASLCQATSGFLGASRTRAAAMLLVVAALGAFGPAPAAAEPPQGYPFLAYDEGLRRAAAEHRHLFLYFGRLGCGYCDKTNKEAFGRPELRRRYTDHYVLVYVDAESGRRLTLPNGERITEMELGARMKVVATPVFVYLEPDGVQILKVAGVQTADDFVLYDRYVHGGRYKKESFREFLAHQ